MAITYAKLRSGAWGVRSDQKIAEGDTVTVIIKSGANAGQSRTEIIDKIVWTDGKAWLAAVKQRRLRPYECEECGEHVQPGSRCWETGMTH